MCIPSTYLFFRQDCSVYLYFLCLLLSYETLVRHHCSEKVLLTCALISETRVSKPDDLLDASEVSANLYCNSRTSVLGRLRDYLRLLIGRTLYKNLHMNLFFLTRHFYMFFFIKYIYLIDMRFL